MKLAAKLLFVFLVAVMLMTAVASYFSVHRAYSRFERGQQELAQRAATELQQKLVAAWRNQGPEGLLQVLEQEAPHYRYVQLGWVWFQEDAPAGQRPQLPPDAWSQIAAGHVLSVTTEDARGVRELHTYYPMEIHNGHTGGLEVTASLEEMDAETHATVVTSLLSILGMACIAFGFVFVAGVHWVARPLESLIEKTKRVGAGDLSGPVQIRGTDELSQLGEALNDMCRQLTRQQATIRQEAAERLETLEQLRHADRLKTVGRLATGIAHELGTPLNVMTGRAGLIASGQLSATEVLASARAIQQEGERIAGIIRQLLDFARRRTPQRALADLGRLLDQTADLVRPLAEKRDVQICCQIARPLPMIEIDAGQMQQVFTNMAVNAIQSMPQGGKLQLQLTRTPAAPPPPTERPPDDCLCASFADQGEGIPSDHLNQIFEPFFTTKDVGEGTGLGLSIAYGIVQEHGGWIEVESRLHVGSRFSVYLPLEPKACAEES